MADRTTKPRIVVTGMGVVSPLAASVETTWKRLIAGRSGIRRLDEAIVPDVDCKLGGVVPDIGEDPDGFDVSTAIPAKDRKKMDRFIHFAVEASRQALAQAGWAPEDEASRERTATVIGSGIGGFLVITDAVRTVESKGAKKLSPFTVPAFLVNLAAGNARSCSVLGAIGGDSDGKRQELQAIGDGVRLIRSGEADIALCGGAEACINRVALGAFAAARALSTGFNDEPTKASRPFDKARDGFVMGEGAGMLVIETEEHAPGRGAVRSRKWSGSARARMRIT